MSSDAGESDIGIDSGSLQQYIEEQIYTLPGTHRHREQFAIALTGSRAYGRHAKTSDVDLDVVCSREVFEDVHKASLEAGLIKSPTGLFCVLPRKDWERYFSKEKGRPHFSLTPLDVVQRHFGEYNDVSIWIWTHAKILHDPGERLEQIIQGFTGYPKEILIRKIKYHWLASAYWAIEVVPTNFKRKDDLLATITGLCNSINELLRVFFLVESKPYPYPEKLMQLAGFTKLGNKFKPLLKDCVDLIGGRVKSDLDPWTRLEDVFNTLWCCDISESATQLDEACAKAMISAGLDPVWVEADYGNIGELLDGRLGPFIL